MKRRLATYLLMLKFLGIRCIIPVLLRVWPSLAYKWLYRIFTRPIKLPPTQRHKAWSEAHMDRRIQVDGQDIQVYTYGEGKPVLLTHGWQGRGSQFQDFAIPLAAAGYKMVTFDLAAHGNSDGTHTTPINALHAIKVLQDEYGPFDALIGHSIGGLASYLSLSQGMDARRLIMIGTPSRFREIVQAFMRTVLGFKIDDGPLRECVKRDTGVAVDKLFPLHEKPLPQEERLLIIQDRQDTRVPESEAELLHRHHPRSKLLITNGYGHNRILHKRDVIEQCIKWLDS